MVWTCTAVFSVHFVTMATLLIALSSCGYVSLICPHLSYVECMQFRYHYFDKLLLLVYCAFQLLNMLSKFANNGPT